MAGRSSWISEYVWIISSATAAGIASSVSPPTASQARSVKSGPRRLPPAKTLWRRARPRGAPPPRKGGARPLGGRAPRLGAGNQSLQLAQGLFEGRLAHSHLLTQALPQVPGSTPRTTH